LCTHFQAASIGCGSSNPWTDGRHEVCVCLFACLPDLLLLTVGSALRVEREEEEAVWRPGRDTVSRRVSRSFVYRGRACLVTCRCGRRRRRRRGRGRVCRRRRRRERRRGGTYSPGCRKEGWEGIEIGGGVVDGRVMDKGSTRAAVSAAQDYLQVRMRFVVGIELSTPQDDGCCCRHTKPLDSRSWDGVESLFFATLQIFSTLWRSSRRWWGTLRRQRGQAVAPRRPSSLPGSLTHSKQVKSAGSSVVMKDTIRRGYKRTPKGRSLRRSGTSTPNQQV
jgi:hypothetical protein